MCSCKHGYSRWCDGTVCLCHARAIRCASLCILSCRPAFFYQLLWLTPESFVIKKSHLSPVFPIHVQLDYFTQISLRFEVERACSVQHLLSLRRALLPFYLNLSNSHNERGEKLKEADRK